MGKFSQKFLSVVLTGATIVSFSGALIPAVNAQSTADLQAQIAALLVQIQQLQAKLGSSGSPSMMAHNFASNLTVGSKGADVTALQQILIDKGFLKIAAATGFFGSLTKAAVSAWQASAGISPAAGYFGPKSRAVLNAMAVAPSPTPTPGPTPKPGPPPPVVGTGLTVALGSNNPTAGSLISPAVGNGAARTLVFGFSLTAGSGSAVNVSEIKFRKVGVLSDSAISGAYITNGGRVIAQYNSISSGVIAFSGLALSVPAGQTWNLGLAIDVAGGLGAGNSVSFSIQSVTDIMSSDASGNAIVETGLPVVGNIFTVTTVTNPSLASLTIASTSIATTVVAGTTNNIVGAWNFTVQNSKSWLQSLNFRVIGSANKTDIKNVILKINGSQVGAALASVDASGNAYFDLTASPGTLNTGSNNLQIYADVMGSPSYTFQFEILNSYDVLVVDSQYNVPILASSNTGTLVTINAGTVTVSQNSGTPTGQIAVGQSSVTVAKFNFYAGGEAVRVKFIGFSLAFAGGANNVSSSAGLANAVRNIALIDDAGGQIGTTINTPPSSNGNTTAAASVCDATGGGGLLTANTYVDCFGTSSSNVNYVVPANTTRVLSLKLDAQSTAQFGTVLASLLTEVSNVQGLTSSQLASTSGAGGSALTLSSSLLTVTQNNALGNQNITANSTHVKVGSYSFTASSASGVTVNTLTITGGVSAGTDFQNLGVWVNGVQFGVTQGVVSNSGVYSFSGSPFTAAAGATQNVDVYADILSGAVSMATAATTLSGCSATSVVSYTAISCTGANAPAGQGITISGQATVTVTADSTNPASAQIVMGSTGNTIAAFRFTETSNVENVKLTDVTVTDSIASTSTVKAAFSNLALYQGSTLLGTAGSAVVSSTTAYNYSFHFGTPVVVPQANSVSLLLKGDAASYASSGSTDNTTHTFKVAAANYVTALGQSSNATSSVTITSANGNAHTVLRTALTLSAAALGSTSGRVKNTTDDLATLTFSANSAGAATLASLTVTFSGSAPSATAFLGTVDLIDANNNSVMLTAGVASTTGSACTATTTCTKSWNFSTSTATTGWQISGGSSYTFKLRANDFNTQPAAANTSVSLGVTVQANTDLVYRDGLDTVANTVNLPITATPLNVTSISYALGT